MTIIEYPAMIYKDNRNKTYIANCMIKNLIGFGKTEEDALDNLKESLQNISKKCEVIVKPMHGLPLAQ